MNKALPILMLIILATGVSFAGFSITSLSVNFKVNPDGTSDAMETADILISGNQDIFNYTDHLSKNDIGSWVGFLGTSLFTIHIDRTNAEVSDIQVRPQPLRNLNTAQEMANGRIIITYKVGPYYDDQTGAAQNGTGLFVVRDAMPRSSAMDLNEKALSFIRSSAGDIMLDDRTTLTFTFPEGTVMTDLNPLPADVKDVGSSTFPMQRAEVSWTGMILPHLVISAESKTTMVDEINSYFDAKLKGLQSFVSTDQGKIMLGMLLFIIGFIIYLGTKAQPSKKGEQQ
jgi:hypothetical protein